MIAAIGEEMRVCSDLQTRWELALLTTSPTPL
jgi:hypothetical protein